MNAVKAEVEKPALTPDEEAYLAYLEGLRQELAKNWSDGHYTQMPNEIRQDRSLSQKAKVIYEQLLSYMWFKTDRCWPSQVTLASATGYSRRSVIRALNELYERGYIEKYRMGLGETNRYFINPLSFVRSFQPLPDPPRRGSAARTAEHLPFNNMVSVDAPELLQDISQVVPRPAAPVSLLVFPEVPNCHNGSAKDAHQEMPDWHTKQTNPNSSNSINIEKITTRSGRAAKLGVEGGVAPATIRNREVAGTVSQDGDNQRTVLTSNTNPPNVLEERAAPESAKDAETPKSRRKKHAPGEKPPLPLPGYLLENILKPISVYFCDQAPTSSETSLAWLYAEFHQRGFDEYSEAFHDLINEARDITNTKMGQGLIRGRNPDGSIAQMKYFFGVLEPSVYEWCRRYDELMEELRNESAQAPQQEEIAAQDEEASEGHDETSERAEMQEPVPPPANAEAFETLPSQEELPASTPLGQQETELSSDGTETTFSSPPLASFDEQQPAPQGNNGEWWPVPIPDGTGILYPDRQITGSIGTTNPNEGWRHGSTDLRAERLHYYLGREHYQCALLPTESNPQRRYGIVIIERETGREKVYVRDWEIEQTMQQHLKL